MKPLNRLMIVLGLLISSIVQAFPGTATIGTLTTNPAANAVLVQTAGLTSGSATGSANWLISTTCSGTVAFTCELQLMNGSTAVQSIYLQVPAGQTFTFAPVGISFPIPQGYTFRVITPMSVTGSIQASVIYALETVN